MTPNRERILEALSNIVAELPDSAIPKISDDIDTIYEELPPC